MNFTPGRTDFYAKLLRGCPGGRNERILVSKWIVKGTYFFVPDGRSLIQRILFTAGKLSGDAKAFNPLSEGEVLHEYNIAAVLSRFLYGELIFRLREASSGKSLLHGLYFMTKMLLYKLSKFFQPPDIPWIDTPLTVRRNV